MMAEEEPLLENPPTQYAAVHVHDYLRFTRMMKWGALTCLVIGIFSLFFIASYW